jgi:hypothetical protein
MKIAQVVLHDLIENLKGLKAQCVHKYKCDHRLKLITKIKKKLRYINVQQYNNI